MILLKSILKEIRDPKEVDAINFIRRVWSFMPKSDRYDTEDFSLWATNEQPLQQALETLGEKHFPTDPEPGYKFLFYAQQIIEKLEDVKNKRMAKKIDPSDPLFLLKHAVSDKNWEQAKRAMSKISLGAWGSYRGEKIDDETAQNLFERLYRNAMGNTYYSDDTIRGLKTLSELVDDGKLDDHERLFLHHYAGYKTNQFPEKVKIWRGTNSPLSKVRPGDFVTFDREYARSYIRGKFGAIIHDVLPSKDLKVYKYDSGRSELVYWPEGHQIKQIENVPSFKEFWTQFR
jgi:hypothetical protein